MKLELKRVREAIRECGTEAALRLLTLEGYLRWAVGEEIRQDDVMDNPRLE